MMQLRWLVFLPLAILFIPMESALCESGSESWPGKEWPRAAPEDVGMDGRRLEEARRYALTGGGSGFIVRRGKLVMTWGDPRRKYDLKSTTKSIGVTALGLAIADGKMRLDDRATRYHPSLAVPPESNRQTGWIDQITIRHLATQTAGFEKPGGYTKLVFRPGAKWSYSDGGPNWLAECITLAYGRDIDALMFERVFEPLGIRRQDLRWRKNAYRPAKINGIARREFGSGISANIDAMARIGYLYLRKGRWRDRQIIPSSFVRRAGTTGKRLHGLPELDPKRFGNASEHYGLLWWNNADGTLDNVPRDAFWSWGLYDSIILVIPSLDLVVARAGRSWDRRWNGHYDVLRPFFGPIVSSVNDMAKPGDRSRPANEPSGSLHNGSPSPVIAGIEWSPPQRIVRRARGSDNWPITWGDDDRLYTAYGDGRGFRPFVKRKLSLGFAAVNGPPDAFQGVNIRSESLERTGDGRAGPKASGLLMVEGVLYLLVRNTGNSQIVWSSDHGRHWTWCDWKFRTSFGCPTFLNFGRNYAGARDDFVYVYSSDADSAYKRADRMVLARVPKDRIRDRAAYEFLERIEAGNRPVWSRHIERRGAVFRNPGRCFRSSVVYNRGLKRYLWCQTGKGKQPRFAGGIAIYDAPEPWGPWTTAYSSERWDVGPGESSSLPAKWMSDDGTTIHLVFSGDDAFSVRRGRIRLRPGVTPRSRASGERSPTRRSDRDSSPP